MAGTLRIDILTLFPGMFRGVLNESMLKIARRKKLVRIKLHDIRKWTSDRHRTADDRPFGGGPGMVMKIEPLDRALAEIKSGAKRTKPAVVLLDAQGERFDQKKARELAKLEHIIVICGHYEGFDERVRCLADMEISIGDYVLTCGELPALVLVDAVARLVPGVLGAASSLHEESFENGLLEYPQYTRPAEYKGMRVPDVLLCGDPKKIEKWRKEQAVRRTRERRPDLL